MLKDDLPVLVDHEQPRNAAHPVGPSGFVRTNFTATSTAVAFGAMEAEALAWTRVVVAMAYRYRMRGSNQA